MRRPTIHIRALLFSLLIFGVLTGAFTYMEYSIQRRLLLNTTINETRRLLDSLNDSFEDQATHLAFIAALREISPDGTTDHWYLEKAQEVMNLFPPFRYIHLIDLDLVIRYTEPAAKGAHLVGRDTSDYPENLVMLERMLDTEKPVLSPAMWRPSAELYSAHIWAPVMDGPDLVGIISGDLDLNFIITEKVRDTGLAEYPLLLDIDGIQIYSGGEGTEFPVTISREIMGIPFTAAVSVDLPTPLSPAFLFGLLLALAVSVLYYWNQIEHSRTRKASEALKESEAFNRLVMDRLPIGLAVNSVEPGVNFSYMNDHFPKFYHTTREKLAEQDAFWTVVYEDPALRETIKKRVMDDCASGVFDRMHWENIPVTRNGKRVAVINATNTPIPGKPLMISTVSDVTQQVETQEKLETNYALLRIAGKTAQFGGWSVDLENDIVTQSDVVSEIHDMPPGYTPSVQETIDAYAPEWRDTIRRVFNDCVQKGVSFDEEMKIITARGRQVWVRVTGEAIRNELGKIIRVQGSFQDITERKKAQEKIRLMNEELEQRVRDRTIQLEALNTELESFSYSVSHDLRAPLRALSGFSQALLSHYGDQLDERGQHYLDRINNASIQMGHLIDDLLKLSRVTRSELTYQQVNLSRLARDIMVEITERNPARQVEWTIPEGLTARGDLVLLRSILENLMGNAWKFTKQEPQAQIKLGLIERNREKIFFIRDNGVGFDMRYAEKLFTPFQRLHETDKFPGTGIGLSTVQRIIARHGGRVWAESAMNQGTAFYFTLEGVNP